VSKLFAVKENEENMEKYKIELDEVSCWCCEMKWVIPKKRYCVICDRIIKKTDKIVLIINNYELFPNCVSHIDCLPEGKINEGILRMLRDDYNNVKEQYNFITKKVKKWGLNE